MKKKTVRRAFAVLAAAGLTALSVGFLAGCDTDHPEITITYEFNGKEYEVDYTLTREAAPQTVRHFLELADAGYYEGMCIHDYDASFMHTGGYYFDEHGELKEKDYFTEVKRLEEEKGLKFTQSVFHTDNDAADKKGEGMYTVYGEMKDNGYNYMGSRYSHTQGALVMYFPEKGSYSGTVTTIRNDNGKYQSGSQYKYNCATAQFYTYLSDNASSKLDENYCVFGMAKKYEEQMTNGLLQAIADYKADHADDDGFEFTSEETVDLNQYDPIEDVKFAYVRDTFNVPMNADARIIVKKIKVNKY